jgi:PadR family transcriptional regulator PadR
MDSPKMTITVQLVLRALLATPGREMYGLEIVRGAGLPSGTVYPILYRLESAGWLEKRTENIDPKKAERPRRSYYRITAKGTEAAREAMARAAVQLSALGVTEGPPPPLSIGGIEIGVTVDERQPPGVVGIVSRGRDSTSVSAFSIGASEAGPEQDRKPDGKGPCEHRIRPGAYCRTCERLI